MEQECPYCKSKRVIKNGTTRLGKQNHECKDCHRQFVTKQLGLTYAQKTIPSSKRAEQLSRLQVYLCLATYNNYRSNDRQEKVGDLDIYRFVERSPLREKLYGIN